MKLREIYSSVLVNLGLIPMLIVHKCNIDVQFQYTENPHIIIYTSFLASHSEVASQDT